MPCQYSQLAVHEGVSAQHLEAVDVGSSSLAFPALATCMQLLTRCTEGAQASQSSSTRCCNQMGFGILYDAKLCWAEEGTSCICCWLLPYWRLSAMGWLAQCEMNYSVAAMLDAWYKDWNLEVEKKMSAWNLLLKVEWNEWQFRCQQRGSPRDRNRMAAEHVWLHFGGERHVGRAHQNQICITVRP